MSPIFSGIMKRKAENRREIHHWEIPGSLFWIQGTVRGIRRSKKKNLVEKTGVSRVVCVDGRLSQKCRNTCIFLFQNGRQLMRSRFHLPPRAERQKRSMKIRQGNKPAVPVCFPVLEVCCESTCSIRPCWDSFFRHNGYKTCPVKVL